MMATTHVLAGLVVASAVSVLYPEFATIAILGGGLGGLFPDLDLYAGHRRTLHYPVFYPVLALPMAALAWLFPSAMAIGAACFMLAAALHSVSDVLGGGLELRPWQGTSDRGVYDHARDRWVAPRRWIRYDGAPEDLGVAIVLAIPTIAVFDGWVEPAVLGTLVVSAGYVALRKRLVRAAEVLVARLPDPAVTYLPDRFFADFKSRSD